MNNINPKELVAMLLAQHLALRADLTGLIAMSARHSPEESAGAEQIYAGLEKFKADLIEHLQLENGTFYTDFLERKKIAGENTEKLADFIKQMDSIGRVVMGFLNTYGTLELVRNRDVDKFSQQLNSIINSLVTRMEAEEETVYNPYMAMS